MFMLKLGKFQLYCCFLRVYDPQKEALYRKGFTVVWFPYSWDSKRGLKRLDYVD